MRAVNSILVACGNLRQQLGDDSEWDEVIHLVWPACITPCITPYITPEWDEVTRLARLELHSVWRSLTSRHTNPSHRPQVTRLACLELRRMCGGPLTSRHTNLLMSPGEDRPALDQRRHLGQVSCRGVWVLYGSTTNGSNPYECPIRSSI